MIGLILHFKKQCEVCKATYKITLETKNNNTFKFLDPIVIETNLTKNWKNDWCCNPSLVPPKQHYIICSLIYSCKQILEEVNILYYSISQLLIIIKHKNKILAGNNKRLETLRNTCQKIHNILPNAIKNFFKEYNMHFRNNIRNVVEGV